MAREREAARDPKLEAVYRLALSALGAMGSGVLILTRDGTVLYANPRAAELFQRPLEELARSNAGAFLKSVDEMLNIQRRAQQGGSVRTEMGIRRADGAVVTIGYTLTELPRLPADQGPERFVCVFQDISQYTAMRKERDRLMRRAVVAEMLPSILHELKNPLAAMTTAVELLMEEVADESVQRDLHAVFKEIRRLDLGMQAFAVAGRDLRSRQPADIGEAIREAVRVLEPVAADARIHLRAELGPLPLLALNYDVVRGMVFNIVRASFPACMPEDEIIIYAGLEPDGTTFQLISSDNGPAPLSSGLSESGALRMGRAGVAMLLCLRAVEAAGGSLTLRARHGGGAETVIRVPFAVATGGSAIDTLY